MEDKIGKYLRESGTTWGYKRVFVSRWYYCAPDVCNGVGSHWVENINWVRVASDLGIKTTDAFAEKLKVN